LQTGNFVLAGTGSRSRPISIAPIEAHSMRGIEK